MQARLTTKPVQEVIAAIQTLDLESVKLRVMHPERGQGWTRNYAESIEAAYKSFLSMLVKYPDDAGDILLSEDVDEFWHAHILHTMKYADDCQHVFGNFLHHSPQIGEGSPAEADRRAVQIEKTRRLYLQEFGPQAADAAWYGATASARGAYCDASARTVASAYCDATARQIAYCDASIRADKATYCDAAMRPAYCDATVRVNQTAYCDAAVKASKTAYCDAAVRAGKAAYCDATARTRKVAYSDAVVRPKKLAYCDASIRAVKVAYCDAAAITSEDTVTA